MKDKGFFDLGETIRESEEQLFYKERHQSQDLLHDRMRFLRLLKVVSVPCLYK
jgi:hypothetical protein